MGLQEGSRKLEDIEREFDERAEVLQQKSIGQEVVLNTVKITNPAELPASSLGES